MEYFIAGVIVVFCFVVGVIMAPDPTDRVYRRKYYFKRWDKEWETYVWRFD